MEGIIEEIASILLLKDIKGFGPTKFRKVYEKYGSFTKFVNLILETSKSFIDTEPIRSLLGKKLFFNVVNRFRENIDEEEYRKRVYDQLEKAKKVNGYIITYFDKYYPHNLYCTNQAIPLIYVIGDINLLKEQKFCAVVGTRRPSEWTIIQTQKLVKNLVEDRYVIVSGLAEGVDALAHKVALENRGKTIAVVGCGPDVYYPPKNRSLQDEIKRLGLILSEYPFGTRVTDLSLKKRNKILVGLSDVVFITETSIHGGTMNSYLAALEQKKPVKLFLPQSNVGGDFSGNLKIYLDNKVKVHRLSTGDEPNLEKLRDVKCLMFDLDGTLWDSSYAILVSILSLLREKGVKTSERNIDKIIKSSSFLEILRKFEIRLEHFWRTYRKNYDKIKLFSPSTKEILSKLVESKGKIGIVTTLKKQVALELLDHFNLKDMFSVIISPSETRGRKPSPIPILKAIDLLNIPKNQVIYIGNTDADIQAAKSAGCLSGLAAWNKFTSITRMPDYIFYSFEDLLLILK
jgi:DNA protecting protein DprA